MLIVADQELPDTQKTPVNDLEALISMVKAKENKIQALEKELNWFKEQFKLMRQRAFGPSTEKNKDLQIELIFNEGEASEALSETEEQQETLTYTRRKPKECGRKIDTTKLERQVLVHDLLDEEKICQCGCALEKIGEDISEQVDHIPEQLKVIEHVRPKYCCRQCKTIKMAAKPDTPLPKSMATANLIADVILKKYLSHLPLYRQSALYHAQGYAIDDNTLGNWVMSAAEVLQPLSEAGFKQLLQAKVLQVDETPVKVLNPNKQGYMWAYHSCDTSNRFILFEFNLSRSSAKVNDRLGSYSGFLQTDGYSGYNTLRHQANITAFGCWDHCRRKFAEVVKISGHNKSGKAGEILLIIGKLYDIEALAKGKSHLDRKTMRQEKAKPILALLYERLKKINAPPQSALGKAVQYALNQWIYLIKYADYGEVEISNCWVENHIRPFALGRRNWLFVGNESSANKSALLYSLIQTCKLNQIDPRKYLVYVLNHAYKIRRKEINPTTLLPQFIDKKLVQ
jgi:transposase